MRALRRRYWEGLPTRAYRIRRLVRAAREDQLQPGERQELELLTQRLAESGTSYGFSEISRIAGAMLDELREGATTVSFSQLESSCDELDQFIDNMSLETLALRLGAVWY